MLGRTDVQVVSNPEFLREGTAVPDSLHPERIVVGADDQSAAARVGELFAGTQAPLLITDAATAETIKYASNAFLATKLSFVNAVAGLCEAVGADVRDVILGLGYDKRIGFEYLKPGPGWGGSCLPKDTRALVHIAEQAGYDFSFLKGAIATNDEQFERVVAKVHAAVAPSLPGAWRRSGDGGEFVGAVVAVWGLTFKAGTDDLRNSPAMEIALRLAEGGAEVRAYDPTVDGARGRRLGARPRVRRARGTRLPAGLSGRLRGVPGRLGGGRPHRVGRVPLARLRQGPRRTGRPGVRRRPQPPRPGPGAPARLLLRRDRPPVSGRRRRPRRGGFLGSHLCDQLLARGDEVVCVDDFSTGRRANVAHLADHDGFTLVEADISVGHPRGGRGVAACFNLASPASPPDYLALPLETLAVGSEGTRNGLELAARHGARFLMASTSEVYGDPDVHPQSESYWGNVNPVGPRSVYDEAKRFAEALTMAHHRALGTDVAIVRIFNTYGPAPPPRRRPGGLQLPPPGHAGRAADRLRRRQPDPEPLLRRRRGPGLLALFDSDLTGPVNIGNPDEYTVIQLAQTDHRAAGLHLGHRAPAAPHRRPDPAPARHRGGPGRAGLGAHHQPGGRPGPTAAYLAEDAGIADPAPSA